jgi:hypothetical protein
MSSVELIECRSVATRVAPDESLIGFFRIGHGGIIAATQLATSRTIASPVMTDTLSPSLQDENM